MLALDLGQRVAERAEEVLVRAQHLAVHVELDDRLRLADGFDLSGEICRLQFLSVISEANFTTLNGLPASSRIGL